MNDATAQEFESQQQDAPRAEHVRVRSFVSRPHRPLPSETSVTAVSDEIEQSALRFSTLIGNLRDSERRARDDLAHALARADQLEARVTQMQSELNTANMQRNAERDECVRLMSILANMGSLINDAMDGAQ
jgi:hypothetical protein